MSRKAPKFKGQGQFRTSNSKEITSLLRQISNSLAYLLVHTNELKDKSKNDLIPILADLGYDRNSVASILQTTPENVSVRLSQLKVKSKARKKIQAEI